MFVVFFFLTFSIIADTSSPLFRERPLPLKTPKIILSRMLSLLSSHGRRRGWNILQGIFSASNFESSLCPLRLDAQAPQLRVFLFKKPLWYGGNMVDMLKLTGAENT